MELGLRGPVRLSEDARYARSGRVGSGWLTARQPADCCASVGVLVPNAGSWQALLGTDEEEEPALMEALARLNEELSEMAQEI